MSTNPIEELRQLESPVTEQEWSAILQDKRYIQKFGRKPGLSPKGRAAIIGSIVAVLITVPILVKTLSRESTTDTQEGTPKAETSVLQEIATSGSPNVTPSTSTLPTEQATPLTPVKVMNTSEVASLEPATSTSTIPNRLQQPVANYQNDSLVVTTPSVNPLSIALATPSEINTSTANVRPTAITNLQRIDTENIADSIIPRSESESEPEVSETDEFFIPSAFTPNGDGLNDLFYVKANFDPVNFEMTIMSRNGDLLFHSRDMSIGWDGKLHGNTLPHGMYVYIIKYKDHEGKDQKQQGQILLIP